VTGSGRHHGNEAPIGRRMAELRMNRGMTQQVFADRIGRSKSWVDKVERGVRTLDRFSMIETVAGALGVTPQVLLPRTARRTPATATAAAVEGVREALARHHLPGSGDDGQPGPSAHEHHRQIGYAWTAYRNGYHPQVLRMLPDLIDRSRHRQPADAPTADCPVRVYRLAAQVLVKLGEPHLAWLAADRAMTAATGAPHRAGLATVSLVQALRALRRSRLAMTAAVTAMRQLDPALSGHVPPPDSALTGTLLIEAALAAATCGDTTAADEFTGHASRLATFPGGAGQQEHDGGIFNLTAVALARALVALRLGDHQRAVAIHQRATADEGWRVLPAEHRAAHLIDIARAHLDLGDHRAAGRALIRADGIAPAETRTRPAAHHLLTAVLRAGPATPDVTRLASTIGLTRR
jgi:transcriptional regulator with XRE-family HTH domain